MDADSQAALRASVEGGVPVAVATVVTGPGVGKTLLVWPAGHTRGDLGWPRLNQRAALYAETLFQRNPRSVHKRFDVQGASVEVAFEFHGFEGGPELLA